MKKLLLIIAVCLFSVFAYAHDSIKIPINDTAKLTVTKVYNDAKSALTGLAAALKVGSEHVYSVLVKQQVVNSVVWAIVNIVLLIGSVLLWRVWFKSNDKDEWWGIPVLLSVVATIIFFFTIEIIVSGLINPEYGAMKDIVNFIK